MRCKARLVSVENYMHFYVTERKEEVGDDGAEIRETDRS